MGVFSRILTSLLIGIAVAIGFIILIAVLFEFIVVLVPSDVKEGLGILGLIIMWFGTPIVFIVGSIISFLRLNKK